MEPPPPSASKCLCCKQPFLPSPRNRATQRFCSLPDCRKASKARSNRKWRDKNPGYDRGPENVERVRQWRAAHPGYSRGKKRKKPASALQDLVPTQVAPDQPLAKDAPPPASDFAPGAAPHDSRNAQGDEAALQDLVHTQDPLVLGLIDVLGGGALQESFVPFARRLVERGWRIKAQQRAKAAAGC